MYLLSLRECSRSRRAKGFLNLKSGLAPGCGLLVVLLAAALLFLAPSEKPLDTHGWKLTEFLAHLQNRGVQLHVVPGDKNGILCQYAYLTEDADATWESMLGKPTIVERIHHWHGTVWVEYAHSWMEVDELLAQWGPHGCRIGNFLLFGDEQILQRIQEACRQQSGR